MFSADTTIQTWMVVNNVWEYPKLRDFSLLAVTSCISKSAYWLGTYSVKVCENICYQTQILFIFVIFFSEIGQCFRPAQTKMTIENQKAGHVGIILNKIWYF